MKKPGKVQAIAIYSLVLGVIHAMTTCFLLLYGFIFGLATFGIGCLIWILVPLPAVTSVLELLYASKLLPDPVQPTSLGKTVAIAEICNVLYCNGLTVAGGIVSLVFYSDPEVREYLLAHGVTNIGGDPALPLPRPEEPGSPGETIISPPPA
jgi:hypothetical protein